jgi:hypothetical protein
MLGDDQNVRSNRLGFVRHWLIELWSDVSERQYFRCFGLFTLCTLCVCSIVVESFCMLSVGRSRFFNLFLNHCLDVNVSPFESI